MSVTAPQVVTCQAALQQDQTLALEKSSLELRVDDETVPSLETFGTLVHR